MPEQYPSSLIISKSNSVLSLIRFDSIDFSISSKYLTCCSKSNSILLIADLMLDSEVTNIIAGKILRDSKFSILLPEIGSKDSILSITSPKKFIL